MLNNANIDNNIKFLGKEAVKTMEMMSDNYLIKTKQRVYCIREIDKEDVSQGIVNFRSERMHNMYNYICESREDEELFLENFYSGREHDLLNDLLNFKDYLIENGSVPQYSVEELNEALHRGDIEELHNKLEKIFMDKIETQDMNYLLKVIDKKGYSLDKLINRHNKKPRETFYSTISMSL